MKMKKRSLMEILLIVCVVICCLSGCGNHADKETLVSETGDAAVNEGTKEVMSVTLKDGLSTTFPLDEPVTMDMFAFQAIGTDLTQNLAWTEMEKCTNMHWNLSLVTSTDFNDKRGLSFSGGEYADVYFKSGIGEADAKKYANEGIILPLNNLIDQYMPNFKAVMDELDAWKEIKSTDGNIYSLPMIQSSGYNGLMLFINEPWLKALNLESPKSWNDFVEVLRSFKTQDPNGNGKPDEIPLYLQNGTVFYLLPYYGLAVDGNTNATYEDGKLVYYPTSETYRNFLKELAAMKAEGLINDYITATWDEQAAIGQTQDIMGCFLQYGAYQSVGTDKDEDFPALEPWTDTMPLSTGISFGGLVITDTCEHPELVAQWADYFYSREGSELAWMGVEGESYKKNDDGTYDWITDGKWGEDMTEVVKNVGLFGDLPNPGKRPALIDEGQTNPEEVFLEKQREIVGKHLAEAFPKLSWTEEEMKKKATYAADISPYVNQYEAQVINGEVDLDATWDGFVQTLKDMGVEDMNAIDQAAVDRYYEAE